MPDKIQDKIPDKCFKCRFFKLLYDDEGNKKFGCMLSKPLILAPGCPNNDPYNFDYNI